MDRQRVRFFLPDWDDTLDRDFDFVRDAYGLGRTPDSDKYAHELISPPPYDGILISRAVAEDSPERVAQMRIGGARRVMRIPRKLRILGDCGAFSYVNEREPLYETSDVLDFYEAIGVDYGVAVDHLIVPTVREAALSSSPGSASELAVPMPPPERTRRQDLTLANADDFIRLHKRRRCTFVPVGSAQGWDPASYASAVNQLLRMGYRYIAIGGLARSKSGPILQVLEAVNEAVSTSRVGGRDDVRFHVFGVAKLDIIDRLPQLRVVSIDSASLLRKAWLRSGQNYLTMRGDWYTAVRVPQSGNPRVQQYIAENGHTPQQVEQQETAILERLNQHGGAALPRRRLEKLIDDIVEYDMYLLRLGADGQGLRDKAVSRERYRRTLVDRPWEQCSCPICKEIGIHVILFRGTNRNKRRGFHNTWVFHQRLQSTPSG